MKAHEQSYTTPLSGAMAASAPARAGAPAKLQLHARALYGVGEASNAIKSYTLGIFLLFFYSSVRGLPGTLVGIALSLSLIWDAVVDPLIGNLSDRARLPLGRRHSFMLAGSLSVGVCFYALFNPPAGLSNAGLFTWLLLTNLLLRTANSVFLIPYYALGAELSHDYHERTALSSMRIVASLIATLLAATSAFMVFFPDSGGADPKFNPTGYWAMGLAFGAVLTITSLVATLSTLSVRQHSDPAPDRSANRLRDLLSNVLLTMSNRSFRLLTFSASLLFLATVINATLSLHFLTYYAGISSSQSLTLLQLGFALSSLVGVAFWARAAQRIDKHRLYLGATLATALLLASAYMLVGQGRLFGMGNLWPILVGRMLAGFFASALWVLTPSMIADIGDEEELARGQRHEGAFFGVFSLFNQGSTSLALVAAGLLLDHFAGLVPGQPTQSPLTIDRLAVLSSWLPAALFLMGAALMGSYRLGRQQVEIIQSELNRCAGFQGQRQASNKKETQ